MSLSAANSQQETPGTLPRFLLMGEVEEIVRLNKRTIQRMVKAGEFPQPVRLNKRSIAFVEGEVRDWMERRMENHRAEPEGRNV